ncbi:MAG: hypothetical protein ACKO13_13020, partial [Cytophagales bacterium]
IAFYFLISVGISSMTLAQNKRIIEQRTFEGIIVEYVPSVGVAYDIMVVKEGEKTILIRFNSTQGKEIIEKFPAGKSISGVSKGRVKRLNAVVPSRVKNELNEFFQFFLADSLVSAKSEDFEIKSNWDNAKKNKSVLSANREDIYVLFDQEVIQVMDLSKTKKAFLLSDKTLLIKNGLLSFGKKIKTIRKGDKISSMGFEINTQEGEVYPIAGFEKVKSINLLEKAEGIIESFYFKQNGACIGFSISTSEGKLQFNFPVGFAEKIMEIGKRNEPVKLYYDGFKGNKDKFLFPTIHGLISKSDTLQMTGFYYGDPDGKHEYTDISGFGTISKVNFSERKRIVSIIVDDKYLIEIDQRTEMQLRSLFRKGSSIKFEGDQRVKKEGEVYQFNYEIVNPKKLILDGREFLLYSKK